MQCCITFQVSAHVSLSLAHGIYPFILYSLIFIITRVYEFLYSEMLVNAILWNCIGSGVYKLAKSLSDYW